MVPAVRIQMLRGSGNAYGFFAILLHWLIALLILALLALGYIMTRPDIDPALHVGESCAGCHPVCA